MSYLYVTGKRWKKWTGDGDVRAYRAPKGWEASGHLCDRHPITGKQFRSTQWWIYECFVGEQR